MVKKNPKIHTNLYRIPRHPWESLKDQKVIPELDFRIDLIQIHLERTVEVDSLPLIVLMLLLMKIHRRVMTLIIDDNGPNRWRRVEFKLLV